MAAGGSSPSPQALQQVMADVERLGTVDSQAQAQLLEELRQVDPSLWPMAVKSVWSRVAYARRFNQDRQKQHLADRRPARIDRRRKEINLREEYPAGYPTTSDVPYPTTDAMVESPLPDIGPPARPNETQSIRTHRNESSPAANTAPTGRPRRDGYHNGYIERGPAAPNAVPSQNGGNHVGTPPWPGQGAALDAADSRATTAAKAQPSGVIHTAYHADPSDRNGPSERSGQIKHNGPSDDDWRARLAEAITLLESRLAAADSSGAKAAEAKRHLSDAARSLGESAILEVRNMAFCREVQSYGSIKQFEKREFSPGQRLLLYAEIDNFHSENTAKGYHTSLRSSFQIFDGSGHQIDKRVSTTTEEHCLSPRRDYFIGCDFLLPTNISPGRHTLKLTVEDLKSHKVGESSIDFTVVKR